MTTARGRLYAGSSGFSYPSWRGGFYPADARPDAFLRHYAARTNAVELNNTFYRQPESEQFARWAAETPEGFRFAVTVARGAAAGEAKGLPGFCRAARGLGDRLGPLRIKVPRARDDGFLERLLSSLDPELAVALDFRHESWDDPEVASRLDERGAVRAGALEGSAPFRYLRLREPPYGDDALSALAATIRPLLDAGADVYCFFRHEDEPTAPAYATRLRELVAG
ncbi:MAG TPA: DUF72 domain-containing protein [Gaiellaceae bacterium]|nr:DUF72 domain-containing protein [Gaiellaceae bacterium]